MAGRVTTTAKCSQTLHVVAVLPPPLNGMTHVTSNMVEAFRSAGPVRVSPASDSQGRRRGIRWTLYKHVRFLRALLGALMRSPDRGSCYFVPDSQAGLWLNLVEAPLLRLAYDRVWLHHHVFSYVRQRDWRMALILKILGHKARHIVLGPQMKSGLKENYNVSRATVLGNTPFVHDVPMAKIRTSLQTIGFLGNITQEKGINLFLETAELAQTQDDSLNVLIAGPVSDQKLRAKIEDFCAADPVHRAWVGPVSGQEKVNFFNRVDVLLFPSLYNNEALPVTIYEALAAGSAILATPKGCIPNQVPDANWIHPKSNFATKSVEILSAWRSNPEKFAKASLEAFEYFQMKKNSDRNALNELVTAIFQR